MRQLVVVASRLWLFIQHKNRKFYDESRVLEKIVGKIFSARRIVESFMTFFLYVEKEKNYQGRSEIRKMVCYLIMIKFYGDGNLIKGKQEENFHKKRLHERWKLKNKWRGGVSSVCCLSFEV